MKISLVWLFEHIMADWRQIDVSNLVSLFNQKTAEIEGFTKVTLNSKMYTVAQARKVTGAQVELFSPELQQSITVSNRIDLQINDYYLLKVIDTGWFWAGGSDFDSVKSELMPALYFENEQAAARWATQVELEDYILEIDNKSITNRPDLWGHRGLAREVAALLDLELRPLSELVTTLPIQAYAGKFEGDSLNPISLQIGTSACRRLAGLGLSNIANLPSQIGMGLRLFRLDMRAINNLVDLTNYVMLDLGQPMHVFDADQIRGRQIRAEQAQSNSKLTLLNGTVLDLLSTDIIISDGQGPISLAGIKGGASSGCNARTKNILIEAAIFDATTIRRSSTHHKIRTEASARYEKTLDPNQNLAAIERLVYLQQQVQPDLKIAGSIISLGEPAEPKQIILPMKFINDRLGFELPEQFVLKTLHQLGCAARVQTDHYLVTVPTYRSTKDITLPIDLVEELGRLWGYDRIKSILPSKIMQPGDVSRTMRIRQIKQGLAISGMREALNYAFYDQAFLAQIKWEPAQAVTIKNPVSDNWRQLVTSLIPHLSKNIQTNSCDQTALSFFEWGRSWSVQSNLPVENRVLAGVWYHPSQLDFYACKSILDNFLASLKVPLQWCKASEDLPVWFSAHQTANLVLNGQVVGQAGMLSDVWMGEIAPGQAFGFELNGDQLLNYQVVEPCYQVLARYQATALDISVLVPLAMTVADLISCIKAADSKIYQVDLIDSFQKSDWVNQKSLTFRYHFVDRQSTMTSSEIASVQNQVEQAVQQVGGSVR